MILVADHVAAGKDGAARGAGLTGPSVSPVGIVAANDALPPSIGVLGVAQRIADRPVFLDDPSCLLFGWKNSPTARQQDSKTNRVAHDVLPVEANQRVYSGANLLPLERRTLPAAMRAFSS
jgi:hypothetical protein